MSYEAHAEAGVGPGKADQLTHELPQVPQEYRVSLAALKSGADSEGAAQAVESAYVVGP